MNSRYGKSYSFLRRSVVLFAAILIIIPMFLSTISHAAKKSHFSVLFIDCGQGDSAIIECDGQFMLIDGGDRDNSQRLYTILKNRGIKELTYVVASHPDTDHIGGLLGAFNFAKAQVTFCNTASSNEASFDDFSRYVSQKGGGITVPKIGDKYNLGSATVEFLGLNAGGDDNDNSLIVRVTYGKNSFMFTGDAAENAECALMNSGLDLSATVLKVAHHGSSTSTSVKFLDAVQPEYAVISVGSGNTYGHPTEDVLTRLYEARTLFYRTDLHGDIEFISDGETLTIKTERLPTVTELFTSGAFVAPIPIIPGGISDSGTGERGGTLGTDYIGNVNSMVFHYVTCKSVAKMKESNKFYYTGTRDEMISMGYKPCGNCHP